MLPDFYNAKKKYSEFLTDYIQEAHKLHLGPFSEVPNSQLFEGHQLFIQNDLGEIEKAELHEVREEIELNLREYEKISTEDFRNKINKIAEEIAHKRNKVTYEEISKYTKKAGTDVKAKGKQLTPDNVLEGFERLLIPFDPSGRPELPTIVTGPKLEKTLMNVTDELKNNPKYRKKLDELLIRKKREWDEREAARKLVG